MELDVEECKTRLARVQRKEDEAIEAAIVALQKAFDAKYQTRVALRTWTYALGHEPKHDHEALILMARRDRKCRQYITRALHVGYLARLGF